MDYWIVAYYKFVAIENPEEEVFKHKAFFEGRNMRGRIYLSREGINGQMSAVVGEAKNYMKWLCSDIRFRNTEFKIHTYHEHVFPRKSIKMRPQLVALDAPVDMSQTAEHVSPKRWRQMLERPDADTLLLDVRNEYEWRLGHFEGAELPQLEQFREFPRYAKSLKESRHLQKTKIMMYCTGGIRCELYSALLKEAGFENVYQLQGGVIKYGLEEGARYWRGKLFVFDDRLAVSIGHESSSIISSCSHCGNTADLYYNCANMDCNDLFIACLSCAEKFQGCCDAKCQTAPRLRPFEKTTQPKPFRRCRARDG